MRRMELIAKMAIDMLENQRQMVAEKYGEELDTDQLLAYSAMLEALITSVRVSIQPLFAGSNHLSEYLNAEIVTQ